MLSVSVLRSSSSGNSTLIWNTNHAILVDCGLGPRVTEKLLGNLGFSIADLSGVLLTHAHSDHSHTITIDRFFQHKIPVYCLAGVKKVLRRALGSKNKHSFRTFSTKPFAVGTFGVTAFSVRHDSEGGCVGFSISSGSGDRPKKISLVTDYGQPEPLIKESIKDSQVILIASNYCSSMIKHSTVVPAYIKLKHIIPFHPSNDECASVLLAVAQSSAVLPKAVFLLHVSKNHNTVTKAVAHSQSILDAAGYSEIRVLPTYRDAASETMCLI